MIIFLSDGRLGNQIFQYMFLKTIAKKNEAIICIRMQQFFNVFSVENQNIFEISNRYCIFIFKQIIQPFFLFPLIKLTLISYIEQKKYSNTRPLPEWTEKIGLFSFIRYVNTDYFQSESFFYRSYVRELHFQEDYLKEATCIIKEIPNKYQKIFVHIRRKDYLHESFEGEIGLALPKKYYEKAINLVKDEIGLPFFIFLSDDVEYVISEFKEIEPKLISKNSQGTDLAIMTMCDGGIIANSSYSWWGAYLIPSRKIVIAPQYWYGWRKKIDSHKGIYPSFAKIIDFTD